MDLDKLEKLANLVLKEFPIVQYGSSKSFIYYPECAAAFNNLMAVASKTLPEHKLLFDSAITSISNMNEAKRLIRHLLDIIEIEKISSLRVKEMKVFQSAGEKMKQAGLSFQNEDFPSTFHSLNTAFELVLKDKIGIPTTITGINTSNIVEVLIKHKVEPYLYFKEVKKRVTEIDNKIKHQGYSPSKIDAINGIKAMEDLISRLRDKELKLTEEIRNKICEGL